MDLKIYKREDRGITYKQVVDLLHEAFKERLGQNLRYTCSFMTEEEFIRKTLSSVVFVAIDEDKDTLVGTGAIKIRTNGGGKYGYIEYAAVSPAYKHQGIGTILLQTRLSLARKEGCSYVLSDTSTQATSAVNYHLKNGFKIVGLESYRSTNYWSYVFRLQLKPSFLWNNSLFLKLHYWASWLFIHATRNIDGSDTFIGRLYKKLCKN